MLTTTTAFFLAAWCSLACATCTASGASASLGQCGRLDNALVNDGVWSADTLQLPYGVVTDPSTSGIYVADAVNNRVLFYPSGSTTATRVYGQGGSFTTGLINNGGISAISLHHSQGIALDGSGVYIADTFNNRVLFYPSGSTTASRVYGQAGFTTTIPAVSATSLSAPWAIATDAAGGLYVADSAPRVVYFAAGSTTATRVYGQLGSFTSNVANNGGISADSLGGGCSAVVVDSANGLYIADAINSRVLYYTSGSTTASRVYGQGGVFTTSGINQGGRSADSLSFANIGLALDGSGNLFAADSGNRRILFFPADSTTATAVYGQTSFSSGVFTGILASTLLSPLGMSVDSSGGLYAADAVNHRVLYYAAGSTVASRVYGQAGSFTTGAPDLGFVSANGLNQPVGVAVDASGAYVSDLMNQRVLFYPTGAVAATRVYGQSGKFDTTTTGAGAAAFASPQGVAVDATGGLYVTDSSSRVLYFPSGSLTASRVYGQLGSFFGSLPNNGGVSANSLNTVSAVATDSSGGVYVSNSRVLYYASANTTASRVYGQKGSFTAGVASATSADSLLDPAGVAVDSANNVYIADKGNNRVLFYPAGSTTATVVYGQTTFTSGLPSSATAAPDSLSGPVGVAADPFGGLFVSDTGNNRVLYFASGSTTASRVIGQGGSFTTSVANQGGVTADSLSSPRGIATDASGGVYITDLNNNRVNYVPCTASATTASTTGATTSTTVGGSVTGTTVATAAPGGTTGGGATTTAHAAASTLSAMAALVLLPMLVL
jgi:hypothetical protein